MQLDKLKLDSSRSGFNKQILFFFIKLFILVSVWFFVYGIILNPGRIIDKPITDFIAASSAKCLNLLSPGSDPITSISDPQYAGSMLVQSGKKVFGVMDICNGIDLMFIYAGIIVLLPFSAKRKFVFCIGGIIAIILANVIRITSLYLIYFKYSKDAFDFSHHYLFTLLMYVLIFYGWILFIKKSTNNEEGN
jgi:exosortase/archaeosortase family protein